MYFGSKTVTFRESSTGELEKQNLKNSSVVVPVDVKMSAKRYHNLRPYVTAGAMAAFDVSKRKDGELLQLSNTDVILPSVSDSTCMCRFSSSCRRLSSVSGLKIY